MGLTAEMAIEKEIKGIVGFGIGGISFGGRDIPKEKKNRINELKKKVSILVVDDDITMRELFKRLLGSEGYSVDVASDGRTAIEKAKDKTYDIAFIDIVMPGINGYLTFLEIKKANPDIKAVMMTGYSVESVVKDCMKKDAYACINKPFARDDVLSLIEKIWRGL